MSVLQQKADAAQNLCTDHCDFAVFTVGIHQTFVAATDPFCKLLLRLFLYIEIWIPLWTRRPWKPVEAALVALAMLSDARNAWRRLDWRRRYRDIGGLRALRCTYDAVVGANQNVDDFVRPVRERFLCNKRALDDWGAQCVFRLEYRAQALAWAPAALDLYPVRGNEEAGQRV
jgi:hypothetical protein